MFSCRSGSCMQNMHVSWLHKYVLLQAFTCESEHAYQQRNQADEKRLYFVFSRMAW